MRNLNRLDLVNSQRKSHTHLQFAQASATTKNCKRVCLANPRGDREKTKHIPPTMCINHWAASG